MILAGLFADLPTWAVGLSVSASLEEESMGTVTQDLQSVKWFDELGIEDVPSVGGKNASLGEMYRELAAKGVKVPNGFAVTADAYRAFLKEGKLDTAIRSILNDLDTHDLANLYLFNCRSLEHTMLHVGVFSNPWIWGGVAAMAGLQLLLTYVPIMNRRFIPLRSMRPRGD